MSSMDLKPNTTFSGAWFRGGALALAGFGFTTSALSVGWAYSGAWISPGQTISAAALKADLNEFQARIATLEAAKATWPECPRGYVKAAAANITLCKGNGVARPQIDEIVRVGTDAEAFWIDRYEASVWSASNGTGSQYGAINSSGVGADNYPATFPDNGQRGASFAPVYALSKAGTQPSTSLTWFQAQEACRASGKRLPTDVEWLRAGSGTVDPGASSGAGGACVTQGTGPRAAGTGTACVSVWGAQDMIGSVWEWTAEWYAGPGWVGGSGQQSGATTTWALPDYNSDGLFNFATSAQDTAWREAHPVAAFRGGPWNVGTLSGVFALAANLAPSASKSGVGFRCVVPAR
jgi:formylglycine-generating enzyme required for sulfatase activity